MGTELAGYRIDAVIGRGGMGVVYRANHLRLGRSVALKLLAPQLAEDEAFQRRFQREARLAAALDHPNIVPIYDAGEAGGTLYIAMRYVKGNNLNDLIRGVGRLSLEHSCALLAQAANALDAAHEHGLVHRDVKPANFLIEPNTGTSGAEHVYLTDFGITMYMAASFDATTAGGFIGSVGFMAPEQFTGGSVDGRNDQYSLACVLFQCLTEQSPFMRDNSAAVLLAHLNASPPRVTDLRPDLSTALDDVVAKAMAKNPDERYPTCAAFVSAVQGSATTELFRSPHIRDTSSTRRSRRLGWGSRRESSAGLPLPLPTSETTTPTSPDECSRSEPRLELLSLPLSGYETTTPTSLGRRLEAEISPERVAGYKALEHIASGRTGSLYKVYDFARGRVVALKTIPREGETVRARLLRGSRAWLNLDPHPNVVRVHHLDPGDKDRDGFILMDFIEGVDLGSFVPQAALSVQEVLRIAVQVCCALEHIHKQGIVHREVEPSNIMVDPRSLAVTLLDSGIARPIHAKHDLTAAGEVVGDISQYVAPEQAVGRVDRRADLYALGVVLLELLGGRVDSNRSQTAAYDAVDRLSRCPPELHVLLRRLVQPNPDARMQRAEEAAIALRALLPPEPRRTSLYDIVVTLHGIRTHARWQRAFAEVATAAGLDCRLDRWNFGYFSVFRFLSPWARSAKVEWFRQTFREEFGDLSQLRMSEERPAIVAHSFGTYILGNALLRYPYLRFGNVLLCGSILPRDFPWDVLLDRGQVQSVRNEYGARDLWTRMVDLFIPGTGASGLAGFARTHAKLFQDRYDFAHSEYFERGHMEDRWLPFLRSRSQGSVADEDPTPPPSSHHRRPWGAYAVYGCLLALAAWSMTFW